MFDSLRIFSQFLFSVQRFYQICRNLSLDVVLGALVMNAWIAKCFQVSLEWTNYTILGLTVWLIYTLDHLIDAQKLNTKAHTSRHQFHQQYAPTLWICGGCILLLDTYLTLFELERAIFFNGCWVLGFTIIHFFLGQIESLHQQFFFQKEARIALVYVLGVGIAPFSLMEQLDGKLVWLFAVQVFLYAWLNLSIISWYELEIDQLDGHTSLATRVGRKKLEKWIWLGLRILIITNGYSFYNFLSVQDTFVLSLMTMTVGIVWQFKRKFSKSEHYRIILDAIFLLPLINVY